MNKKLFFEAIIKFFIGVLTTGLLIFIPAGSFGYPNGRLLMAILFIPMFIAGIALMVKNPKLLKERLDFKEKQSDQKWVVAQCTSFSDYQGRRRPKSNRHRALWNS